MRVSCCFGNQNSESCERCIASTAAQHRRSWLRRRALCVRPDSGDRDWARLSLLLGCTCRSMRGCGNRDHSAAVLANGERRHQARREHVRPRDTLRPARRLTLRDEIWTRSRCRGRGFRCVRCVRRVSASACAAVIVPNVRTTSARGLRSTLARHDQHDHTASNRRDADKRWERHGHDIMERRRGALQTEILKLEEEPARFVAAIAIAGDVETLAQALREREQRPTQLRSELVRLERAEQFSAFDVMRIERTTQASGRLARTRTVRELRRVSLDFLRGAVVDRRSFWTLRVWFP